MRTNPKVSKPYLFVAVLVLFLITLLPWQLVGAAPEGNNEIDRLAFSRLKFNEEEARWDDFFTREMANYGVYGAIMVVVTDDQIVLEKAYGYADAATKMPMDTGRTIVRAGSIAKTVTAMAVLQLAEEGRLDLDVDVNDYLTDFKIPDTFPEPVTARHLINMTGGFDTRWIGIRAESRAEVMPLGEYLAKHMPPRVLPPGKVRRYNDHELALAGYLVEVISGMPYENYLRKYIFEPLEMYNSSVLLPEGQLARAARGYPVGAGREEAYPFKYYYLHDAPGSGFNTTARDLSHLIMAHLKDGQYPPSDRSPVRVLKASSMQSMHQTAFAYHPKLVGQANTFDERFYNGQRYLRKDGGAPGMNNSMLLLTEQGIGMYLFYNSDGYGLRRAWLEEALSRYLSTAGELPVQFQPASHSSGPASRYTGLYREVSDEVSETSLIKINALVNPDLTLHVGAGAHETLMLWGDSYAPVEPDLFRGSGPMDFIYFSGEPGGQADYLYMARFAYKRVPWLETPMVQYGMLGFAVLVFGFATLVTTVKILRRRASGYRLAGLISGLNLVFLTGLILILLPVAIGGNTWLFSFAPSLQLRLVLALPVVTLVLAVGLLGRTSRSWWKRSYSLSYRLFNTVVLMGMAAWLVFLQTWNLLGWRF